MFVRQVLEFLDIKVPLPIEVNVDNAGAIFLARNGTTGQRTKHIDIRHHYVREYVEDDIVIVKFVNSEDNDADPMTKNPSQQVYEKNTKKYMEPTTVHNRGDVENIAD